MSALSQLLPPPVVHQRFAEWNTLKKNRIGQCGKNFILRFRTKIKNEYYICVGIKNAIGG